MESNTDTELLKRMLEIYSPSKREAQLAAFLEQELEKLSFENVKTDKAGNVYGEIGSGSPAILFCGHMDTVLGWIPVKTEDNKVYGRGATDAKSPLAAMISAASSLRTQIKKGKVTVAGVVEEEHQGKGIRQLLRDGLKTDYAIFGEPSGLKNITFAYKGHVKLRITCKTKSGHVGAQHLLDNAIEKSLELWTRLKTSLEKYKSPNGVFYSVTPCLIGIRSYRTFRGIPNICTLHVDLRVPPTLKCKVVIALVKEGLGVFQAKNPEISLSLGIMERVEPFVAKRDSKLIQCLSEAVFEITGEPAKLIRKTGTGDMNIFGASTGIPVATYGPGDSRLDHTSEEYVELPEYLRSIQVYRRVLEKLLS